MDNDLPELDIDTGFDLEEPSAQDRPPAPARRRTWVAVLVVGVLILLAGTFVLAPRGSGWEGEFRARIQNDVIDQPDFAGQCLAMYVSDMGELAAQTLAGMGAEGDDGRTQEAAEIAVEMIGDACGL